MVFSLYIYLVMLVIFGNAKNFFAVLFTKSVYVYVMKIQWCQRQTNVIMWHSAAFKVEKLRKNFVESKFSSVGNITIIDVSTMVMTTLGYS